MSALPDITEATFDQDVLESDRPTVVEFWSPRFEPCRKLAAITETLAAERSDVRFVKMNVDDNAGLAEHLGVEALPAVMLFRDGAVISHASGVPAKADLSQWIDQMLHSAPAPEQTAPAEQAGASLVMTRRLGAGWSVLQVVAGTALAMSGGPVGITLGAVIAGYQAFNAANNLRLGSEIEQPSPFMAKAAPIARAVMGGLTVVGGLALLGTGLFGVALGVGMIASGTLNAGGPALFKIGQGWLERRAAAKAAARGNPAPVRQAPSFAPPAPAPAASPAAAGPAVEPLKQSFAPISGTMTGVHIEPMKVTSSNAAPLTTIPVDLAPPAP